MTTTSADNNVLGTAYPDQLLHAAPPFTTYFKIISQSRARNGGNLVISAGPIQDDKNVYVREEVYGDDAQLWSKQPMRNGKGYALVNKARGTCVFRVNGNNGSPLMLGSVAQCAVNDLAVWRDDGDSATYNAINSWADWEQKINIPGNGPYADGTKLIAWEWSRGAANERWVSVPDEFAVTLKKIEYDLSNVIPEDSEPLVAEWSILVNDTAVEQTQTLKVSFLDSLEYSFQSENSLEITEGVEFSGGIPGFGKAKVAIEIKGSWKHSTGTTHTSETEVSLEVPVKVPALSSVRVTVTALRARIDVPYKATFTISYKDQAPFEKLISGRFTGVNSYNVATKFESYGQLTEIQSRKVLR